MTTSHPRVTLNTISNAAFPFCGILGLIASWFSWWGVAFAVSTLALGVASGIWHATERRPYNRYDRYAIFLVLAVLVGAAVDSWLLAVVLFAVQWAASSVLEQSTEIIIGVMVALLLAALTITTAHVGVILASVAAAGGAAYINYRSGYTGITHSVWHVVMSGVFLCWFLLAVVRDL